MVTTFAPEILMSCGGGGRVQGYGASSLWKQRAHRWTVSALRITGNCAPSLPNFDYPQGNPFIHFLLMTLEEEFCQI